MANLVSRAVVCRDDPVNGGLRAPDALSTLTDDEHVLLVLVVWLRCGVLLLRVLAADQYLAASLLLESLLIKALRPNEHANVIDSRVLRNVDFVFYFRSVLERV